MINSRRQLGGKVRILLSVWERYLVHSQLGGSLQLMLIWQKSKPKSQNSNCSHVPVVYLFQDFVSSGRQLFRSLHDMTENDFDEDAMKIYEARLKVLH